MARDDSKIPSKLRPITDRIWSTWLGGVPTKELEKALKEVSKQMKQTDKEIKSLKRSE